LTYLPYCVELAKLLTDCATGTKKRIDKSLPFWAFLIRLPFDGRTTYPQTGLAAGTGALLNFQNSRLRETGIILYKATWPVSYYD